MSEIRIAIAGFGKIAHTRHVPQHEDVLAGDEPLFGGQLVDDPERDGDDAGDSATLMPPTQMPRTRVAAISA